MFRIAGRVDARDQSVQFGQANLVFVDQLLEQPQVVISIAPFIRVMTFHAWLVKVIENTSLLLVTIDQGDCAVTFCTLVCSWFALALVHNLHIDFDSF